MMKECWYCNPKAIKDNGTVTITKRGFLKILADKGQFLYSNHCPICKRKFRK